MTVSKSDGNAGFVAMVLSSVGLMADIYDMTVINLIRPSLVAEFGEMTAAQNAMVTGSVLVGCVLGQTVFGFAADCFGRYRTFILTALIVCASSLGAALVEDGFLGVDIYTYLIIFRFTMGVGIGGEYPLSAANTVENTEAKSSSFALAFAMGGMSVGGVLGPVVVLIASAGMGLPNGTVWRLAFAFAAFMAGLSALLRWVLMGESKSFKESKDQLSAATEQSSKVGKDGDSTFAALLTMRWSLLGTGGSWFLYNIVTFGTGLFSTTIFHSAAGYESAVMLIILSTLALPGVVLSLILVQYVRMRDLQMAALATMAMCFAGMSWAMEEGTGTPGRINIPRAGWVHYLCVALFAVQMAADSTGPSVTCYAIPAQIYPTRIRGVAHGISAAVGKLGAVLGTFLFPFIEEAAGLEAVLWFMTATCVFGVVWTWSFIPSYWAADYEEAFRGQKGSSLVRQAEAAERLLFATERERDEALPIVVSSS